MCFSHLLRSKRHRRTCAHQPGPPAPHPQAPSSSQILLSNKMQQVWSATRRLGPGTLVWPHTCRLSAGKSFQLNHSVALFACQMDSKAEKHKLKHHYCDYCDYSINQQPYHALPYNRMVPKSLAHHFRRQHRADLAEAQASHCQQSPAV